MTPATYFNSLNQPIGEALPDWKPAAQPRRITLHGNYCRLEPLDPPQHADSLFEANDDNIAMWTYLPYGPFATRAEYRAWVDGVAQSEDALFFAIVDLRSGRAIGLASYLRVAPAIGSIEVGQLAFSPALQQRTAATEAMFLMMQEAFALGYRRYEWKCNALNQPSRRAAQRLGFSFEGVFRQANIVKGRNRDTAWYSVIDSEWPALSNVFTQWLAPTNFTPDGAQLLSLSAMTAPLLMQRG